ncbi:Peptidase family M48 [Abditibacterium utsteinense]|uniref:Peptidase family M48 n=1 Tax=Abditibacterium utsteinense TaxID=1960156 RepID=A0A2S8SUM8_9BACT|nr:M48 family metallopeptidase [Abditibacterium utsteinense]PQV64500.1 Peptidase family M48 [Abditibacterium utsteinense]
MKKSILFACGIAASLVVAPQPAHAGLFSISPDKERKIGQEAAASIEKGAPLVTGPVEEWVQRIGARLAAKSGSEFKYTFHVVDAPQINAFCLPGGHIFVYTGLRKVVRTDDELAAVLAHEITHAEEHHYAKQFSKSSKRGALIGAVSIFAGLPGVASQALGILDFSMSQKYSRENESEADTEGLFRMKRAGFDPNAMVTVLQRLSEEDDNSGIDQWMSDHPEGKKRVAKIQSLLPTLK